MQRRLTRPPRTWVGGRASGKTTVTEKLRAAYTDPHTLEEATHFGSMPTVTVHVWDTGRSMRLAAWGRSALPRSPRRPRPARADSQP